MNTSERKHAINQINSAFDRLTGCCDHTHDWDRYIAIHEEEEKDHRRFKPDGIACGLTKAQSIRLFAVKEVFERFVPAHNGERIFTPEAKDYLHVKRSVFAACSIAHSCREEILREFTLSRMSEWLRAVDYVKLNKAPLAETREYQPKTGAVCSCKRGVERDNCPRCEGTGMVIDFAKIRAS